jgi:hypothetical protein
MAYDLYKALKEDPLTLIPGVETYRWIKEDKSKFEDEPEIKILLSFVIPLRDLALVGTYEVAIYGMNMAAQKTIENLF